MERTFPNLMSACANAPRFDDAVWLGTADWLIEQGDPRGDLLHYSRQRSSDRPSQADQWQSWFCDHFAPHHWLIPAPRTPQTSPMGFDMLWDHGWYSAPLTYYPSTHQAMDQAWPVLWRFTDNQRFECELAAEDVAPRLSDSNWWLSLTVPFSQGSSPIRCPDSVTHRVRELWFSGNRRHRTQPIPWQRFAAMTAVRSLTWNSFLEDNELRWLESFPELESLRIRNAKRLTAAAWCAFEPPASLQSLQLDHANQLPSAVLIEWASRLSLRELRLAGRLSPGVLVALRRWDKLRRLHLTQANTLDEEWLSVLGSLRDLECLTLTQVSGAWLPRLLRQLHQLPNLWHLEIGVVPEDTEPHLHRLGEFPHLESLALGFERWRSDQAADLADQLSRSPRHHYPALRRLRLPLQMLSVECRKRLAHRFPQQLLMS
ncbi:unnamed protein product [Tuwongella immobilis]|uniref:Repeat-companion domain protein n=1 Tax=Tuwongella immobilis TaxID=692036 RepID=A0A6C2YHF1_9BACT|nr:unnamed protein product [Tuwongella immobilis]VTR96564.1 unnamed protein product [Tuwongella immobilis]